MTPAELADFFGVLSLVAIAVTLGVGVAFAFPTSRETVRSHIDLYGRTTAWIIALIATAGSLWFSEGAHFTPCKYCWLTRIVIYPMTVVLGIRAFRRSAPDLRLAGLILMVIAIPINAYHVAIQTRPSLAGGSCDPLNPCSGRWVEGLGFFTIPRLASVTIALLLLLLIFDRSDSQGQLS